MKEYFMKICPNCKNQNEDTAKFCDICGTPLPQAEEAPAPAEPTVEEKTLATLNEIKALLEKNNG